MLRAACGPAVLAAALVLGAPAVLGLHLASPGHDLPGLTWHLQPGAGWLPQLRRVPAKPPSPYLAGPGIVAPKLLISGLGESGTTAVTRALLHLGLVQCSVVDLFQEPAVAHEHREVFIPQLLKASKGEISAEGFQRNNAMWNASLLWLRDTARKVAACIDQEQEHGVTEHTVWGFKEPKYIYILPALDAAFQGHTKFLVVVRDPRDTCSGWMKDQFYGWNYGWLFPHVGEKRDCYAWWADIWTSVLDNFENAPNLKIVRIEDLVLPDPDAGTESLKAMQCVMEHAGMHPDHATSSSPARHAPPFREVLGNSLREMHKHSASYMGHHYHKSASDRKDIEFDLARRTDLPIIHSAMRRLGYDPEKFGMITPGSKRVCLR